MHCPGKAVERTCKPRQVRVLGGYVAGHYIIRQLRWNPHTIQQKKCKKMTKVEKAEKTANKITERVLKEQQVMLRDLGELELEGQK